MSNVLRNLPSVSELLESPPLKSLVSRVNRSVVVSGVRRFLDDMRTQVQTAAANVHVPAPAELAQRIADWIATDQSPMLIPVINATGIILSDQLGRAPLAEEAIQMMAAIARGYCSLEIELPGGNDSERTGAVEGLLTRLTGAEAATVVNNNAAAMLVTLAALAGDREVIVSRGQLIESAGNYRLPEIVAMSGAILREAGTTNKTRVADYAAAVGEATAALLRVHKSNYAVVGDTQEASLEELVALAAKHDLPLIDDLGSGSLFDLARYGLAGERLASDSIRVGADLVLMSGDQFLGGPQCGIIVGRRSLVRKIMEHPLLRAVRVDKLTLAALAATLRLYHDFELAERSIPVLSLLSTSLDNLRQRAERLAPQIAAAAPLQVEIVPGQASIAGTGLIGHVLPTVCLALSSPTKTASELASALGSSTPAVLGRVENGKLILDLRSVPPREDIQLVAAIEALNLKRDALVTGPTILED